MPGGVYTFIMRVLLVLSVTSAACCAVAQYNPVGWYPYLDFGSSQAYREVSTGAPFQHVAWAKDLDTYQDLSVDPPKNVQLINYGIDFHYEITSGTVQGGPNISFDNGKITYTYNVIANTVTTPTYYNDRFRMTDTGALVVKDANTPWTTNVVKVNPPQGGG